MGDEGVPIWRFATHRVMGEHGRRQCSLPPHGGFALRTDERANLSVIAFNYVLPGPAFHSTFTASLATHRVSRYAGQHHAKTYARPIDFPVKFGIFSHLEVNYPHCHATAQRVNLQPSMHRFSFNRRSKRGKSTRPDRWTEVRTKGTPSPGFLLRSMRGPHLSPHFLVVRGRRHARIRYAVALFYSLPGHTAKVLGWKGFKEGLAQIQTCQALTLLPGFESLRPAIVREA